MPLEIKITSDFICPWCLIGHHRLLAAIDTLPESRRIALSWLPFELNPTVPVEGMDRKTYRTAKFGSWERSQALDRKTVEAAVGDGIAFDYDRMTRTPNTFNAHRLSWHAAQTGRQQAVVGAVLAAYFEQGRDIGDLNALAEIASEAGLSRTETRRFLDSDTGRVCVRSLEETAHADIRGVPHFDIGGTIVEGAQSVAVLRDAICGAIDCDPDQSAPMSQKSGHH